MITPNGQTTSNFSSESPVLDSESEINFIDVLIALGQEKITILIVTVLFATVGVVNSLLTAPVYSSRTSIVPTQQGGASALANLSGLASLAGLSGVNSAIKSSDQMYVAFMRSQSVQTVLIEQHKLKERYRSKNLEEARLSLTNRVSILVDKPSGLLIIEAQDGDPEFAALLANQHVHQLNVILSRLAITEAQQRRLYYEQQIEKTQQYLPILEAKFKEAQRKSGVEVASLLSESGSLPGQIAARELQLQVLSRFATLQNPEMKRLSTEITALRSQLSRYELAQIRSGDKSNTNGKVKDTSPFLQEAAQAYATLKIQETLLDGFVRQLEVAKIDEAKEGSGVQVLDIAKAPEIRSKPQRKIMVLTFTLTGLIIGLLLALLRALLRHLRSTTEGINRLRDLKQAWSIRGIKS